MIQLLQARPLVIALLFSLTASGQQLPVESRTELDVQSSDGGGLFVGAEGVDAGVPLEQQVTPPALVRESPAPYPESLAAQRLGGEVVLQLLIDEGGAIGEVTVEASPHALLTESATRAARGLVFTPGRLGETPVAVRLRYTYRFEAPPPPPPQEATLVGVVRAKGTRAVVSNASVLVSGEADRVVQADETGRFTLQVPVGMAAIVVRAPGYAEASFQENFTAGEKVEVVYRIDALVIDPYVTVVRDDRVRTEVTRVTLSEQELREVPGTQGDPFRVVMLLPGVASVASGISYPVVRGSQPAATGYFIDGVQVPQLFHLFLGPAVVHPDFIDKIDFYPGSAPVRYGRLLGGVVDGAASRPREDRLHASGYADLINAGLFVETPVEQTGTHLTLSGRYSYTGWLLAQLATATMPSGADPEQTPRAIADFWDYQGRIEQKLGPGRLRLLALGSSDLVGTDTPSEEALDVKSFVLFHRLDLRYRHPFAFGETEVGVTWGYEQVGIEGTRGDLPLGQYVLRSRKLAARASWEKQFPTLHLSAGFDVDHRRAQTGISGAVAGDSGDGSAFQHPLTLGTFTGGWVQAVWQPHPEWTLTPGLRVDNFHLVPAIDRLGVDPRLTVRHTPREWLTLKAGAAIVHQPPTVLLNLPVMDISGLRYGLQEAWVMDGGVELRPYPGFELNVDVYYNHLARAFEFDLDRVLQDRRRQGLLSPSLGTTGRSFGLEVLARHPLGGNWFGWLSYSFQRSTRQQRFVRTDEAYEVVDLREGELPFAFDQTHIVNAAVSYKFPGNITAGVVAHFNTGRPEGGQITSRTSYRWTDPETGQETWRSADRDQVDRLPPFFRIDARVAKAFSFDDFHAELYLDVLNVFIQRETLGYDYTYEFSPTDPFAEPPLLKRPIEIPLFIPMLGFKASY